MEVAPTAHYSMGGIKVCADRHSTSIEGLFAAGEVMAGYMELIDWVAIHLPKF